MSIDPRCRHDRSVRELAAGMFDEGRGCESVAKSLGIPAKAVRKWQLTYRAVGRDGLLKMGKKHARYDFETKVAAARAVVEGGMSKPGAMERFGIASSSPLDQWCRPYRGGGAEALRPRPRGRPRGSGSKAAPMTREQEPGREAGRPGAQVAYPRKSIAPEAEPRSRTGRRP
ncbi:helix-turn-helix domain-containing protein [Olsenella porci]|nr:helix-turn-helix domain-containing protein [Olsenella porci]